MSLTSPNGPGPTFLAFLAEGKLKLQVCQSCNTQVFFPRTICPSCGAARLEWQSPSGRGTVYSTTVVRQRPDRGGDYNIAVVEFAEGARMMSRVEEIGPHEVRIGMAVEAVIKTDDAGPIVVFRPAHGDVA